jgi:hypothetical protein
MKYQYEVNLGVYDAIGDIATTKPFYTGTATLKDGMFGIDGILLDLKEKLSRDKNDQFCVVASLSRDGNKVGHNETIWLTGETAIKRLDKLVDSLEKIIDEAEQTTVCYKIILEIDGIEEYRNETSVADVAYSSLAEAVRLEKSLEKVEA